MEILTLKEASAGYGKNEIIHHISFSVNKGEYMGILGPNGSGKSTLLRMITGLLPLSGGALLLKGKPLAGYSAVQRAKSFGTVFIHQGDLPSFTAEEYIIQRLFSQEIADADLTRKCVQNAAAATGTGEFLPRNIRTLSAGELQLVSIAGAVAQNGSILILDEPTAHLDIQHTLKTTSLLAKLHASGTTIISVFHDISLAVQNCTRIIALSTGSVYCDCTPGEFIAGKKAEQLFGVQTAALIDPFSGKPAVCFSQK